VKAPRRGTAFLHGTDPRSARPAAAGV